MVHLVVVDHEQTIDTRVGVPGKAAAGREGGMSGRTWRRDLRRRAWGRGRRRGQAGGPPPERAIARPQFPIDQLELGFARR